MIIVFRYGHRFIRDKRLTTHCALIAHAFNANQFILHGNKDQKLINSIEKMIYNWGEDFKVSFEKDYKDYIISKKNEGYKIVHLTMYGLPFQDSLNDIKNNNAVVIIGSKKVASDIFELADYNLSIGNLPHSEAAALAVFLYELFDHKVKTIRKSKKIIIPSKAQKIVKS